MSARVSKWALLAASASAIGLSGGGCVVAGDLVNPALLPALGLDPELISGPVGRVVVSFTNNTRQPVDFFLARSVGANSVQQETHAVEPAGTDSAVLDCPVDFLAPATIGDMLEFNTAIAATVFVGEGTVDVAYTGAILQGGVEFTCGDVIAISMESVGTGEAAENFAIRVRILPGR